MSNKYRAKRTIIDGILFHSKGEANRYCELKLLEKVGKIKDLKLQVPFKIYIKEILICKYIADFVYFEDSKEVVEDFKGVKTASYNLKKKLMKAVHNIEIKETANGRRRTYKRAR